MRKMIICLLSICFLFTLSLSVAADVIWEPYGDSFYEEHMEEIEYEDRNYKATADIYLYDAPNGKKLDVYNTLEKAITKIKAKSGDQVFEFSGEIAPGEEKQLQLPFAADAVQVYCGEDETSVYLTRE